MTCIAIEIVEILRPCGFAKELVYFSLSYLPHLVADRSQRDTLDIRAMKSANKN